MTAPSNKLRIVALGYVVRCPLGGMVWSNMHYLMGLARLGHDVWYCEDSSDDEMCYDPSTHRTSADPTYGLAFATTFFERIGLADRWAYWNQHERRFEGAAADTFPQVVRDADLVLNLAGVNELRPFLLEVPARAFVDEDPAFNQIRNLQEPSRHALTASHTSFLTFAENMGSRDCRVPDDGFDWVRTRQPLVPEALPMAPPQPEAAITSVLNLDSYSARIHEGERFGLKADSVEQFLELPEKSGCRLELAASGPGNLRQRLTAHGWHIRNPIPPTRDPWTYESYIRCSKAEIGIAKHGYVTSRSGWFSERSVAYLSTGRPVLHQDTGFADWLPTGHGVLEFATLDDAVAALREVERNYEHHCRAAREIATAYFDYRHILPGFLEQAMCAAKQPTSSSNSPDSKGT